MERLDLNSNEKLAVIGFGLERIIEKREDGDYIKVFDDYDEAMEYAIKMNEIEYPPKKLTIWEKIVKFFTRQNN